MLPWRRISLVAAALFAATLVAITAFELAAGKPVSSMTGGSDGDGRTAHPPRWRLRRWHVDR